MVFFPTLGKGADTHCVHSMPDIWSHLNPHTNVWDGYLFSPFYWWRNGILEILGKLPKGTQTLSGIQTGVILTSTLCSVHHHKFWNFKKSWLFSFLSLPLLSTVYFKEEEHVLREGAIYSFHWRHESAAEYLGKCQVLNWEVPVRLGKCHFWNN